MLLLFCLDPANHGRADEVYRPELAAAEALGIPSALVDHDALTRDDDPTRAVRFVPEQPSPRLALYRGWMMSADRYRRLYDSLNAKGVRLLNDPAAYRHTHHLPESYPAIESQTPRSVWLKTNNDVSTDDIIDLLRPFGSAAVIVKDYVKSRKHEWSDACFIPSASDYAVAERIVRRFLQLQGDQLTEGLVIREFIDFQPLGAHPRSGMPLTKEFRLFFLDGRLAFCTPYWDAAEYDGLTPPIEQFAAAAARVRSRFFTMDVAQRRNGDWLIVELGDGQVAGLPEHADLEAFYRSLSDRWPPSEP